MKGTRLSVGQPTSNAAIAPDSGAGGEPALSDFIGNLDASDREALFGLGHERVYPKAGHIFRGGNRQQVQPLRTTIGDGHLGL